jgi:hypothetical protein
MSCSLAVGSQTGTVEVLFMGYTMEGDCVASFRGVDLTGTVLHAQPKGRVEEKNARFAMDGSKHA